MLQIIAEVIKQNIAESSAEDNAQHRPHHIILNSFSAVFIVFMFYPVAHHQVDKSKSDNVHEAVIAQLKRPDTKKNGADLSG